MGSRVYTARGFSGAAGDPRGLHAQATREAIALVAVVRAFALATCSRSGCAARLLGLVLPRRWRGGGDSAAAGRARGGVTGTAASAAMTSDAERGACDRRERFAQRAERSERAARAKRGNAASAALTPGWRDDARSRTG
jgi:hypothetical protein